ncbi:hypothetical protein ACFPOU_08215 [Massilia jejuensis]|uniref:Transglycosylase-like protein with SLT domain n=1 Tax=Massilia jejuensis TaxID=648894 RepID=A0ABW0PFA3_9BURK
MVTIENTPPQPPLPAMIAPAPAGAGYPESADERVARYLVAPPRPAPARSEAPAASHAGRYDVLVPQHIPPHCIHSSASAYNLNPLIILSVMKVESGGRMGLVSRNTNGTDDLGPGQFNTGTWAKLLIEKYKIPREALINDMCQAVRGMGFAIRTEINGAGGDLWKGIGNYHSRTPKHHVKYVRLVYGAYKQMTSKGKF